MQKIRGNKVSFTVETPERPGGGNSIMRFRHWDGEVFWEGKTIIEYLNKSPEGQFSRGGVIFRMIKPFLFTVFSGCFDFQGHFFTGERFQRVFEGIGGGLKRRRILSSI